MAFYQGSDAPDIFLGGNEDDIVTGIGRGLDIISTGGGNDTVTIVPDGGGLLDLLPDIINMGTGNDDHLIIDSRTSNVPVVMARPLLNLTDGLFGLLNLNGLERLTFSGVERFTIYGGTANDNIATGDGNDVIDGGRGADRMIGGSGNDAYYVDNAGDVIVEIANGGVDIVHSSISYRLADTLENLNLSGSGDINGYGNRFNNVIQGSAGDNYIDGVAGADRMIGGLGDDTYVVNSTSDVVVETQGQGVDTVLSSVSFSLTPHLENLTLTGSGQINAKGNAYANVLTGNDAGNRLDGGGGTDTLIGGLGNDVYVVNLSADVIVENANEGIDRVISSVSWRLGENVEYLQLSGSANILASGNAGANYIWGNTGDNVIYGGGGRDVLHGGAGVDRFNYDAVSDSLVTAYDVIRDLEAHDIIDLSDIDANSRVAGDQAFTLVSSFTKAAGQIMMRYDDATDQTTLSADVNGDGIADFRIRLSGDHMSFDNFVF